MYFLHSILVAAKNDPDGGIAKLMRTFTFIVVPTINPDGHEYSRDHSRLWRKNRQHVGSDLCQGELWTNHPNHKLKPSGIDLNSNWGYKWRPARTNNPCSDTYGGSESFEAYETRAMAHYLQNGTAWNPSMLSEPVPREKVDTVAGRRVRAFVDLHSYGQLCELQTTEQNHEADVTSHVPLRSLVRRLSVRRGDVDGGRTRCGQGDAHAGWAGLPGWTGL